MNTENFKKQVEIWFPFGFCAFLSVTSLYSEITHPQSWWYISFLAFLPLCFFGAGTVMMKMSREILQLRQRLEEIEKKDR